MDKALLAGQRLILGFDGLDFNDQLAHIIRDLKACGIILFKDNIHSPQQVEQLCNDVQAYAAAKKIPPLIICADQEGGVVARFREPWTMFPGGQTQIHTLEQAAHFAVTTASELRPLGINMNLAPVLDIVPESLDSIMTKRAFHGDEKIVSSLGCEIINQLQKHGMMAVAKHFPGIGSTVLDSHHHLPVLNKKFSELEKQDILPFVAAIKNDVTGIMLSHIFYPELDGDWQASLSPAIASEILRKKFGFKGLILTDDMDMKAIQKDIQTCMHQVMLSEIDMALICHQGPNIDLAWEEIITIQEKEAQLYETGLQSLQRIEYYKKKFLGRW